MFFQAALGLFVSFVAICIIPTANGDAISNQANNLDKRPLLSRSLLGEWPWRFHSYAANENKVRFTAQYRLLKDRAERLLAIEDINLRNEQFRREINPIFRYFMGPGTHRNLGNPKKIEAVTVDWATVDTTQEVATLNYTYDATWILNKNISTQEGFLLPVPYNENALFTTNWKACGDSDPDHQTRFFFWYFWDPSRYGCEHKEGVEYQNVHVEIGEATVNQTNTFPEYERLLRTQDDQKIMTMTFAFGYAQDQNNPNPETDYDVGVTQYRRFLSHVRSSLAGFEQTPIKQSDYISYGNSELVIGHQFTGLRGDLKYRVRVVVNAGVDQMNLFAKSFAQEHESFFAWFGHSRVGSGFDADQFRRMIKYESEQYSITDQYQIVYWGGCNSYTYYTLPFFQFKAELNLPDDPHGTKNLDIISNGMPSYFTLNAPNATVAFDSLMKYPQEKVSYQTMIREIESASWGAVIMTNVLGDEDNAPVDVPVEQ